MCCMSQSAAKCGANSLLLTKKYQNLNVLLLKSQQIQMYLNGSLTVDHWYFSVLSWVEGKRMVFQLSGLVSLGICALHVSIICHLWRWEKKSWRTSTLYWWRFWGFSSLSWHDSHMPAHSLKQLLMS